MKKISLHGKKGNGRFALVDDEDYPILSGFKWFVDGKRNEYVRAARKTKMKGENGRVFHFYMHSVILWRPSGMVIDHINGNGLDNRRSNLRIVTYSQNAANRKININNTVGFRGVSKRKPYGTFQAQIGIRTSDGKHKKIYVGTFKTAKEAAEARDKAASKYQSKFAKLNFLKGKND